MPSSKKQRARAVGLTLSEEAESGAVSTAALVAGAHAAVERIAGAKYLQARSFPVLPVSKGTLRNRARADAELAARVPGEAEARVALKRVSTGIHKTASATGGFNLSDAWAEGTVNAGDSGRRVTVSRPIAPGVLARRPAPGTSYNPSVDDHQDAVAVAVAAENAREARRELLLTLTQGAQGRARDVRDSGRAPDAAWSQAAADAVAGYIATLEGADPDAAGPAEEVGEGTVAGGAAARKAAAKGGKKVKAAFGAGAVEDALAAVIAEEAAEAARRTAKAASRAAKAAAIAAGAALPHVAMRYNNAPLDSILSTVPLSSDLTGSLRTMKGLGAGQVAADAMAALVARGEGAPRRSTHAPTREDLVSGRHVPVPMGSLRRAKKQGHPYKSLEFPRRREFEPAAAAAAEAEKGRVADKAAKQRAEAAVYQKRKAERNAAAAAAGLMLPS